MKPERKQKNMDFVGKEIVGYRYGKAPESGCSYNTAEQKYECGVSMAQVGFDKEINSFATAAQSSKKYYYKGTIAGFGGDNEICLIDVVKITKAQYLKERQGDTMIKVSNNIVNNKADRLLRLKNAGYSIWQSVEMIEQYRNQHTKKIKNNN